MCRPLEGTARTVSPCSVMMAWPSRILDFLDHADDGGGEDVEAGLEDAGLLGGFAADEETVVLAAGVVDAFDECEDDVFFEFAADDAVLDAERLCAGDDDVVDQVMDHVAGNGSGAAVGESEFLFGTGFFGFHDQDRVLDAGEGVASKREAKAASGRWRTRGSSAWPWTFPFRLWRASAVSPIETPAFS